MLGLSGLGKHIHSTLPDGATSALTSPSARKAYPAIGGKALADAEPSVRVPSDVVIVERGVPLRRG
jgi:hypothetical protein